jgi:hypothetical protein
MLELGATSFRSDLAIIRELSDFTTTYGARPVLLELAFNPAMVSDGMLIVVEPKLESPLVIIEIYTLDKSVLRLGLPS